MQPICVARNIHQIIAGVRRGVRARRPVSRAIGVVVEERQARVGAVTRIADSMKQAPAQESSQVSRGFRAATRSPRLWWQLSAPKKYNVRIAYDGKDVYKRV